MELKHVKNKIYRGADKRLSLLDVISPEIDGPLPLVIFVHGFKGFKDWGHWPLLMQSISKSGMHVLSFNNSHNGASVEEAMDFPDLKAFSENTYSKELEDLNSIVDQVFAAKFISKDKMDLSKCYLIGHSRGGGISIIQAARDSRIAKLITWAAVDDFVSRLPGAAEIEQWKENGVYYIKNGRTGQDMPMNFSFVEDLMLNKVKLNIESAVKALRIPHLIVHGASDNAVSLHSAEKLKAWNKGAKLEIIEGANHVFGGSHPYPHKTLCQAASSLLQLSVDFLKA